MARDDDLRTFEVHIRTLCHKEPKKIKKIDIYM